MPLQQSTVECTPCLQKKTSNWISLLMRTLGSKGLSEQTPHTQVGSSLLKRRTENYNQYKTTANSISGQCLANTHYH